MTPSSRVQLIFLPLFLVIAFSGLSDAGKRVDLHMHTTISDGTDAPRDLMQKALAKGIDTLSVTDHDIIAFPSEAEDEAKKLGINFIRGIEISCEWHYAHTADHGKKIGKVHLLGYFIDPDNEPLNTAVKEVQVGRKKRNEEIVAALVAQGLDVSYAEWLEAAGGEEATLGRPNMAQVLIKKGYVEGIQEAFDKYLADDVLVVEEWGLSLEESIALIHGAKGIAVIAHPSTLKLTDEMLEKELTTLLDANPPPPGPSDDMERDPVKQQTPPPSNSRLDGLEAFSSRHKLDMARRYQNMAGRLGLLVSGGSDFHGDNKKGVPLGVFGGGDEVWNRIGTHQLRLLRDEHAQRYGGVNTITASSSSSSSSSGSKSAQQLMSIVMIYGCALAGFLLLDRRTGAWLRAADVTTLPGWQRSLRMFVVGNPDTLLGSEKETDGSGKAAAAASSEGNGSFSAATLLICFVGLQVSYLTWGVLQERIMANVYGGEEAGGGEKFTSSQFLVFCNRLLALGVAHCMLRLKAAEQPVAVAPFYHYSFTSVSNVLSSWCQYEALKYISFPTQVLSKSSKVIPVMLMGVVMNGKRYKPQEYVEAGVISAGVALFMLTQPKEGGGGEEQETTMGGLMMLGGYLIFDSFTSQWQGKLFSKHRMSSYQMMAGINTFSSSFLLLTLIQSGELLPSLSFVLRRPEAMTHVLVMSMCACTGQMFIFYTIKTFGPIVFTIIMATRQLAAIFLSCLLYGHPIGAGGLLGVAMVFGAVAAGIKRKRAAVSARTAK